MPVVDDLHQEQARPGLHQFGFGRALFDFHAAFGVDVHGEKHVRVQDRFEGVHRRGLIRIGDGFVDTPQIGRPEGLAQVVHGLFELAHLLCQRLEGNRRGGRRVLVCGVLRGARCRRE